MNCAITHCCTQRHTHTCHCCFLNFNSCRHTTWYPCTGHWTASLCENTSGQELKQSMLTRWLTLSNGIHFYAFLAFIAFIALGASAAAFFAPFFAMLLDAGGPEGSVGMQESLETSFLEPDQTTSHALLSLGRCQRLTVSNIATLINKS